MISGIPSPKSPSGPQTGTRHTLAGAAFLSLIVVCLQAGGEPLVTLMRYERAPLQAGELWRLVTAHLVHLGWTHALLNIAALLLIAIGFGPLFRPGQWLLAGLSSALAADAGLWFLHPGVNWYVGLSGVLHGLVAAAAVGLCRARARLGLVIAVVLAAKLLGEAITGPLPYTASIAGGHVIVQAHLWGALGGAVWALLARRPEGTQR